MLPPVFVNCTCSTSAGAVVFTPTRPPTSIIAELPRSVVFVNFADGVRRAGRQRRLHRRRGRGEPVGRCRRSSQWHWWYRNCHSSRGPPADTPTRAGRPACRHPPPSTRRAHSPAARAPAHAPRAARSVVPASARRPRRTGPAAGRRAASPPAAPRSARRRRRPHTAFPARAARRPVSSA